MGTKRQTKQLLEEEINLPTLADKQCQRAPANALPEPPRSPASSAEPDWCMVLMEQLAEHGINQKTKCPSKNDCRENISRSPLAIKILRVLRHVPEEVFLSMDRDGWVYAPQLGEAINDWCKCNTRWQARTLLPLVREIGLDDRVQFDGEWCRASYGHSTSFFKPTTIALPTEPLFHGTSAAQWESIECFGLSPMGRRYVQLTTNFSYAEQIAARSRSPIVLQILREQAIADQIQFVTTNSHVWLAEPIPTHLLQPWLSSF